VSGDDERLACALERRSHRLYSTQIGGKRGRKVRSALARLRSPGSERGTTTMTGEDAWHLHQPGSPAARAM
jgi:hypothetical protein